MPAGRGVGTRFADSSGTLAQVGETQALTSPNSVSGGNMVRIQSRFQGIHSTDMTCLTKCGGTCMCLRKLVMAVWAKSEPE